ncbi:MAG TPA: TonB-dependent receptor plug domain-containing protein, partial [Flavobacterium sp.]
MKLLSPTPDFGRFAGAAALCHRRAFRSTRYFAPIANAAIIAALLFPVISFSQAIPDSTKTKTELIEEVMVSSTRATQKTPVTFSNFSKKEIEARNLGQDIPMLINYLPGVVTTSDAGNGFGYTGIRVRGSDATRVNVTINGIPYNDSESSGTYFVDLPDFASSLESIQLQRGVGTSTNGAGAFGASLNLLTEKVSVSARGEISNSFGSFSSRKHTVKFSTGLINDHVEIAGRLSVLHSDGYVERAESDLKSYFLQGTFLGKSTTVKALAFGGNERTYQSWFGVDAETLATDPTFNFAGMYTDEAGNTRFYEDEVDDYTQNHFQLHWNEKISGSWSTNIALHYTKGRGFYENYQQDAGLESYGMAPVTIGEEIISTSDLVRRKWLDNDFYGMTFSANYQSTKLDATIGGGANNYEGQHFGEVV